MDTVDTRQMKGSAVATNDSSPKKKKKKGCGSSHIVSIEFEGKKK